MAGQREPDQMVLIVDLQLPHHLSPMGSIIVMHTEVDGLVRTATVQFKDKTYIQTAARLIQLTVISITGDQPPGFPSEGKCQDRHSGQLYESPTG